MVGLDLEEAKGVYGLLCALSTIAAGGMGVVIGLMTGNVVAAVVAAIGAGTSGPLLMLIALMIVLYGGHHGQQEG